MLSLLIFVLPFRHEPYTLSRQGNNSTMLFPFRQQVSSQSQLCFHVKFFSSTPATKKPSKPSVVLLVPRTLNVKILKRRKLLVTTPACKQSSSIGNFLDDRIAEVIQADQRGPVGVPLAATRREQHPHHNDTVTANQQPSGGGMPRQANSFSYLPTVSNSNGQPDDSHNEEIG